MPRFRKLNNIVRKLAVLHLLLILSVALNCYAQEIETPTGDVILTISGAIDTDNSESVAEESCDKPKTVNFDLKMLEKIGMSKTVTETPWTKGLVSFEGVLVRDLLTHVKAYGTSVRASALDNYSVDIPVEDFLTHDVILATRIDGKVLRVRDNGPLWVIYPWADDSNLKRPRYYARSIWQLRSFSLEE